MSTVPKIRPISDLRNKFTDISNMVRESNEPVYLTKNGYGEMVVMSIRAYEQQLKEQEIRFKLMEAEYEAACTEERRTHEEVMARLNKLIDQVE